MSTCGTPGAHQLPLREQLQAHHDLVHLSTLLTMCHMKTQSVLDTGAHCHGAVLFLPLRPGVLQRSGFPLRGKGSRGLPSSRAAPPEWKAGISGSPDPACYATSELVCCPVFICWLRFFPSTCSQCTRNPCIMAADTCAGCVLIFSAPLRPLRSPSTPICRGSPGLLSSVI